MSQLRGSRRGASPLLLALEARAWLELGAAVAAWPWLSLAPRSAKGDPVLVLPGWLASDLSTVVLRRFLRQLGYRPSGWELGRNYGPSPQLVEALESRFLTLAEREGPISLVGWSLGGIYARQLARRHPEHTARLITLAAPHSSRAARGVADVFESGLGAEAERDVPESIPTTAVFSRSDGIAPWRVCLVESGPRRESIEVQSSHCGMGHHPAVLWLVADRLAQSREAWRPFEPDGLAARLLGLRPAPAAS